MLRTDYDADNRPTAQYTARADGTVTDPNSAALTAGSPEASQCTSTGPTSAPAFTSGARICSGRACLARRIRCCSLSTSLRVFSLARACSR